MSTITDETTAAYVGAYMRTYDHARAEGLGPVHASYAATKAADAARDERGHKAE